MMISKLNTTIMNRRTIQMAAAVVQMETKTCGIELVDYVLVEIYLTACYDGDKLNNDKLHINKGRE